MNQIVVLLSIKLYKMANILNVLPELQGDEMVYVQNLIDDMDNNQAHLFASVYRSRRRDPSTILIAIIIGFFGIGGIQRFMTKEIALGLLYLLTMGLCYVGTIVDLINYRKIAFNYNKGVAYDVANSVKQSGYNM
jgi:TM2 domain-containing membrane protein YozV